MAESTAQLMLPLGAERREAYRTSCRAADPETSREAARKHIGSGKLSLNQQLVQGLACKWPGCTAVELWAKRGNLKLSRHEVSRRLPEVEAKGFIRRGERRKCRVSGTSQLTWWAAKG